MSVRQSAQADAIFDLPILEGLSDGERRSVRRALEKRQLKPNETFVEEGAEADHVYFLVAGEVAVILRGALVTFIEAPSVAGLLAVLDEQPRTGTLIAVGAATVFSISKADLHGLLRESDTLVGNVLRFVAGELRAAYAKEDAMHRHLADFFVRPNSGIVPGPYVADPYNVFFFVVRAAPGALRGLLPRGVRPIPGVEDCFALTFNFFDRRHPAGKARLSRITRPRPLFPAWRKGSGPACFAQSSIPTIFSQ